MSSETVGFIPQIDVPILQALPKEGTNLGLKPMGATVRYLLSKNPEWGLTAVELSGRLKSLRDQGYVVPVVILPTNKGLGWQITKRGEGRLMEEVTA